MTFRRPPPRRTRGVAAKVKLAGCNGKRQPYGPNLPTAPGATNLTLRAPPREKRALRAFFPLRRPPRGAHPRKAGVGAARAAPKGSFC